MDIIQTYQPAFCTNIHKSLMFFIFISGSWLFKLQQHKPRPFAQHFK